MTDDERRRYVETSLAANGFRFGSDRVGAIVAQFARIEAIAATFVDVALPVGSQAPGDAS